MKNSLNLQKLKNVSIRILFKTIDDLRSKTNYERNILYQTF